MDDKLKKRIEELVREEVAIVPYNPICICENLEFKENKQFKV